MKYEGHKWKSRIEAMLHLLRTPVRCAWIDKVKTFCHPYLQVDRLSHHKWILIIPNTLDSFIYNICYLTLVNYI
jgi:hypothetical protein